MEARLQIFFYGAGSPKLKNKTKKNPAKCDSDHHTEGFVFRTLYLPKYLRFQIHSYFSNIKKRMNEFKDFFQNFILNYL